MKRKEFDKLLNNLLKTHKVFAPVESKSTERILIEEIKNTGQAVLDGMIPEYPWREFLLPFQEKLFNIENNKLIDENKKVEPQVLLGVALPDLQAISLYNHVFEKDKYYQNIKKNTLVIGYAKIGGRKEFQKWHDRYEEDVLEHLMFDIFIEIDAKDNFKLFTGSEEGQKVLDEIKYKNYQNVEFAGLAHEGKQNDIRTFEIKEKLEKKYDKKLWQDLGKKCLACGKCSIVCPTCFCFCTKDVIEEKNQGQRMRCMDTCFYNNFSKVSGGHNFSENNEKRIYFYHEHKFVRIPEEYQISGCVGCGRCIKACPVGINISETKKKILKSK